MKKIIVVKRSNGGYFAYVASDNNIFASGVSPYEAVGALVDAYPTIFQVEEVVLPDDR